MTELMNLPPLGFFFIVKHGLLDNIPTVFFALQEEGTSNTVSFQVAAQGAGLDVPTLNSILEALVEHWGKEHKVGVVPAKAEILQFASSAAAKTEVVSGEML